MHGTHFKNTSYAILQFFIGLKKLAEQNQIFHFLKINCNFRFL